MGNLQELEPKEVFRYFEEISRIPRGSGNVGQNMPCKRQTFLFFFVLACRNAGHHRAHSRYHHCHNNNQQHSSH